MHLWLGVGCQVQLEQQAGELKAALERCAGISECSRQCFSGNSGMLQLQLQVHVAVASVACWLAGAAGAAGAGAGGAQGCGREVRRERWQ
jgi:hypothetical protein